MGLVSNVARNLRRVYADEGAAGLVAASRYYLARTRAVIEGPGRTCPICGWAGRDFIPLFLVPYHYVRRSAVCPRCGARERQRAFVPALRELLPASLGARRVDVLEISPDAPVTAVLRAHARSYRGSNVENPAPGELQLDLHGIALPDASVDLVVMTYVLSSVEDDRRAMREIFRILRPGGMLLAFDQFTESGGHFEWPAQGHGGGRRHYGVQDIGERFAPLPIELVEVTGALGAGERTRRGVGTPEYVVVVRKPAEGGESA